ncbi:MAG: type II toxin-antitoxin system RelE/ParE family toxin [bacterium]|nr:type II toxin-antitoxin system RelE/ParE family toxin [bacterium]
MSYTVSLEYQAEKELKDLPKDVLKRVDARLQALSVAPLPRGASKLKGREVEGWRVRVGDYRILYTIDEKKKMVMVYRIKHRRDAYR